MSGNGKVSLFIKDYIEKSIESFGEALDAKVSSTAKKGLQTINESSPKMDKQEAYSLHYIVAKLIWVAKRGITKIDQRYHSYAPG